MSTPETMSTDPFLQWRGDDDEEAAFLTFEEYAKLHPDASEQPDFDGDYDVMSAANPDAMAAIRFGAMLAAAEDGHHHGSMLTADELLNVPPAEVEREITRALRRSGIEAEDRRTRTSFRSTPDVVPSRLAVAGLKNVYIDDSFFMSFAKESSRACGSSGQQSPLRTILSSKKADEKDSKNKRQPVELQTTTVSTNPMLRLVGNKRASLTSHADSVDNESINTSEESHKYQPVVVNTVTKQQQMLSGLGNNYSTEQTKPEQKSLRKFYSPMQRYNQSKMPSTHL